MAKANEMANDTANGLRNNTAAVSADKNKT